LTDTSKDAGKWVAILGKEVIASDDDYLNKAHKKAKKKSGNKESMFIIIPKQEEALIL
jgi:hypothetical protein